MSMLNDDGSIVLDFDNIILPEGEYYVIITGVQLKRKKNAGPGDFPYLEFHYAANSRVDGEEMPVELVGSDVMDICSLAPQARFKLKAVLEAFTCREWAEKGETVNPAELAGLEAIAMIVHDSYNGQVRPKASRVYNPDYVPPVKDDTPSEDVWTGFDTNN